MLKKIIRNGKNIILSTTDGNFTIPENKILSITCETYLFYIFEASHISIELEDSEIKIHYPKNENLLYHDYKEIKTFLDL